MIDDRPIAYDICCGLGGWTEALLAEGYRVIGFDIEAHDYGTGGYPVELRLRDITTIHGSELKDAALIVCSPPCQRYSYMAMPWSRAKEQARMIEADTTGEELRKLNLLFDTYFRLQREASEAAGRHIPMIVENVRGAQKWVGRAPYHYGSFYLWGDVPALMPIVLGATKAKKNSCKRLPGAQCGRISGWPHKDEDVTDESTKVPGFRFDGSGKSFQTASVEGMKVGNASARTFSERRSLAAANPELDPHNFWHNSREDGGTKVGGINFSDGPAVGFNVTAAQRYRQDRDGTKFSQSGDAWFDGKPRDKMLGDKGTAAPVSRSNSRKAASAMIAKIPRPLAQHIARTYKPEV